jgi:hypothetical protein
MKHSNYTIGNRTRDLPTCCAVPQLTAPLRAPVVHYLRNQISCHLYQNIYFPFYCLQSRIENYINQILIFIVLIPEIGRICTLLYRNELHLRR